MTAAKIMDIISMLSGCDGRAADAVLAYTQVKMEDAHKLLKIPKSECPDIWIRLPRHKWPKSWSSMEDPVVPLERNLYGHPLAGLMGKAILEHPIETWLGENSKLGMSLCSLWDRILLIRVCGCHSIGWKETKPWSDVEATQQRFLFGRTNIFLGSCVLGLHSMTIRNKQRHRGPLQNHVRISNFSGEIGKITIPSKSSYFFMVLRHGRSWQEVCVERSCELGNKTTQQLYKVSTPCIDDHHFKRKKRNLLENCHMYALKLSWNAYIWQESDDLLFYGQ